MSHELHEEDNTTHLPQHLFQKNDNYKTDLDSHSRLISAMLTLDADNTSDLLMGSLVHNYAGPNSFAEFDIILRTTNNVKFNSDGSPTQPEFHETSSIMKHNEINEFEQTKSDYVDPQTLTLRDHTTDKFPESFVSHVLQLVGFGTPPPSPSGNIQPTHSAYGFLSAADSDQNCHIFEPIVQDCSALNSFGLYTQASSARDLPPQPGPPPTVPLPPVPQH